MLSVLRYGRCTRAQGADKKSAISAPAPAPARNGATPPAPAHRRLGPTRPRSKVERGTGGHKVLPDHRRHPHRGQDPEARGVLLLPEVQHQLRLAGAEAGLHPQDPRQRRNVGRSESPITGRRTNPWRRKQRRGAHPRPARLPRSRSSASASSRAGGSSRSAWSASARTSPSDSRPRTCSWFRRGPCRATGCCSRSSGSRYVAHFSDGMDARIAVGNEIFARAAEADRQDPEARAELGAAARREVARQDHARRHDDPVPVRHAASAAAAPAIAGFGTRFDHVGPGLGLRDHRRGVVPAAPLDGDLPAQRRLAAQAGHRGDPRPLRQDDDPEGGEATGAEEAGSRQEKRTRRSREEEGGKKKAAPKKELTPRRKPSWPRKGQGGRRAARAARRAGEVDRLAQAAGRADGEAGSIADVLGKGDVDRDQEKAFQGVGGIGVANANDQLRGIKSGGSGSGRSPPSVACVVVARSPRAAPATPPRRSTSPAS